MAEGFLRQTARFTQRGEPEAPHERYRNDPVGFTRDVFGINPWDRQTEILEGVRDHDYFACRAGHKVSKSLSAAALAFWWVETRRNGRCVLTAPSDHQLKNILWPEAHSLHARAVKRGVDLGGTLYTDHHSGFKIAEKWGIFGVTTDKAERVAGVSGDWVLIIVDEASGYPEHLFPAIFGNMAGGGSDGRAKVALFSQATQTSGTFFDAFHSRKANWKTQHISSTESPNFRGGNIPGLATPEWEAWAREQWGGPGSPLYEVRVLGNFPSQASNAVIALGLVDAAVARWADTVADGPLEIGVDPARDGDDESVIIARRGKRIIKIEAHRNLDGPQLGAMVVLFARGLVSDADIYLPRVKVDSIGLGTSCFDFLVHNYGQKTPPPARPQMDVIGVNSACSADETVVVAPAANGQPAKTAADEYINLRAQLGFGVREWLKAGGAIPDDGKLQAELVAPTFTIGARGKLVIEEKKEVKKRLQRSPDRADALALAVYEPQRQVSLPTRTAGHREFGGGQERGLDRIEKRFNGGSRAGF